MVARFAGAVQQAPVDRRVSRRCCAGRRRSTDDWSGTDRYVRPHFQLGLSAKYRMTPNIQLFAEMVNLNNAKYTACQRGAGGDLLPQLEEY